MTFLKDIVQIEKGRKYNLLEEHQQGAIRVFQANDFRNENKPLYTFDNDGVLAEEDDILLVWDGSVGQMGFGRSGYIGSTMVKLKVKKKKQFSPFFIYRFLQTKSEYLKQKATGATIMHINRKSLDQLKIPDLDLPDQLHITNLLSKAEDRINQRKESILMLDEFLQSFFLEMFGDPGLNKKKWSIKTLKEISLRFSDGPFGSNLKTEHYSERGVQVIRLQNIGVNKFIENDISFVKESHYINVLKKYTCFPGDIVIATMGDPNIRACIVPKHIQISVNKADCVLCRVNPILANQYYISHLLNQEGFLFLSKSFIHGQTRARISSGQLARISIPVPPIDLQNQFAQIAEKTEALKTQYQLSLKELENLYCSLSQKAFKGELKLEQKEESVLMAAELETKYQTKSKFSIPAEKKGFAKLVLAGKIISECKDSHGFTNIKFQKLQHLAEHLMETDLNLNYYNQAAGPYDNKFMHTLHDKMRQQKWFLSRGFKYSPLEKSNEIDGHFSRYFGANNEQFTKLIKLLGKASEDQCEIISTLYAVWNDRIIKEEPITYEAIVEDFFNWSERKQKYNTEQLTKAIKWMKENNLEPKGFGELIKHSKKINAK
jgi:restriction endonuclease S subunit